MFKLLFSSVAPQGAGAQLSTLIFHRVLPQTDPLFPAELCAARFDAMCAWLKRWFQVLPLDQALQQLREQRLPARALAITFDDGYADNHDIALPILLKHGLTATFFIASDFLNGGCMWNDRVIEALRRSARQGLDLTRATGGVLERLDLSSAEARRRAVAEVLPRIKHLAQPERSAMVDAIVAEAGQRPPSDLMMTTGQLRALRAAGMSVGAHTASHPILAVLDDAQARAEIAGGRAALESLLNESVRLFAYPNGKRGQDYGERECQLVRELGFDAAITTNHGVMSAYGDFFQVPRYTPWEADRLRFGWRLYQQLRNGRRGPAR